MLETILISSACALLVSALAHFVGHWQLRIRLRRCELDAAEYSEALLIDKKRRAAAASVAVRGKGNDLDAALVQKITGKSIHDPVDFDEGMTSMERAVRRLKPSS